MKKEEISIEELKKSISVKIKNLRQEQNLSVSDLSQAIGISKSIIYKMESGKSLHKVKHLAKYSLFFRVKFDYLIGLSEDK